MPSYHGQFVWYELMTTDADAAREFYCAVVGWTARDAGGPNAGYTILNAGGTGAAGMMQFPPSMMDGARPGWIGYVGAEDTDAEARAVAAAGGKILRAPADIPEVGRFAVVADPQGAVFTVFTPRMGEPEAPPAAATPGRVGWHELRARNRESAFAFYAGRFGWTKTDAIDMGPMGIYQTFATGRANGGGMVGGMMTMSDVARHPAWLYYFNVDDIDAAIGRVATAGGVTRNGPHQVPGGSWTAHCTDRQGAMFAMVGPRAAAAA